MNYEQKCFATLAIALSVVLSGSIPQAADDNAQQVATVGRNLPQPVVDTHHLMELFNQPLYRQLKDAMRQEPTDQQRWATIEERGLQAAEVMNLVAIRDRDASQQDAWHKHVQTAQQSGLQLRDAAKAHDWTRTRTAYQRLIRNCNACHQQLGGDHAPQIQP